MIFYNDPLVQLPRYARVNQLKASVASVIAVLEQDGYILHNHGTESLNNHHFSIDPILPDVLVFHSSVALTDHRLYQDYQIILQDKVSLFYSHLHTKCNAQLYVI